MASITGPEIALRPSLGSQEGGGAYGSASLAYSEAEHSRAGLMLSSAHSPATVQVRLQDGPDVAVRGWEETGIFNGRSERRLPSELGSWGGDRDADVQDLGGTETGYWLASHAVRLNSGRNGGFGESGSSAAGGSAGRLLRRGRRYVVARELDPCCCDPCRYDPCRCEPCCCDPCRSTPSHPKSCGCDSCCDDPCRSDPCCAPCDCDECGNEDVNDLSYDGTPAQAPEDRGFCDQGFSNSTNPGGSYSSPGYSYPGSPSYYGPGYYGGGGGGGGDSGGDKPKPPVVVPEPSSGLLWACLLGFGLVVRRRRG
jgi:hypothetical protein